MSIVTVTANPSLDRTVELGGELVRGAVLRAVGSSAHPGGKGVNVSRVLAAAGAETVAVLPARPGDPLLLALAAAGVPTRAVPVEHEVRSNITVTEPGGTTTKLNAPGAALTAGQLTALSDQVVESARGAAWVALCGSLPPGVPHGWYAEVIRSLPGTSVAADTSGPVLAAVAAAGAALLKPNAEELGELTGRDGAALEAAAAAGDPSLAAAAAGELHRESGATVLATLGGSGALLIDGGRAWFATPPAVEVRSTVGAGDSALAGYLLAACAGLPAGERLRYAVAYGSAAASLPGTAAPRPADLALAAVALRSL